MFYIFIFIYTPLHRYEPKHDPCPCFHRTSWPYLGWWVLQNGSRGSTYPPDYGLNVSSSQDRWLGSPFLILNTSCDVASDSSMHTGHDSGIPAPWAIKVHSLKELLQPSRPPLACVPSGEEISFKLSFGFSVCSTDLSQVGWKSGGLKATWHKHDRKSTSERRAAQ